MQFVEEQLNIGKMLTRLGLEQMVLADGVLPNSPLDARASLVKGILNGIFEQNDWETACQLVYSNGPVRGLFDGDWAGFKKQVMDAAKRRKNKTVDKETVAVLAKRGEFQLMHQLLKEVEIENIGSIFSEIQKHISEDDKAELRKIFAERAMDQKRYRDAYYTFKECGDSSAINGLYDTVLSKPGKNFALLLDIAGEDKKRLTEIVQKALELTDLSESKTEIYNFPEKIYGLWKKHNLSLSAKEKAKILEQYSEHLSPYHAKGNLNDGELTLLWAKKNWKEHPADAYCIFEKQKYKGTEALAALEKAIETDRENKFNLDDVKEEHLKAVYPHLQFNQKLRLAMHFNDAEALRDFSRQYYKDGNFEAAYNYWFHGKGDHSDPYIAKIRQQIIEKELEKRDYSPSTYWLKDEDREGHVQMYDAVVNAWPAVGYRLANEIKDEKRAQQAREKMVAQSPRNALIHFISSREDKEKDDAVGIGLAADALAEKDNISRAEVMKYIELGREKLSRGY